MLLSRNIFSIFTRNYASQAFRRARSDALNGIFIDKPDVIRWENIRKQIMDEDRSVNSKNIDALIISKCFNGSRLDIAKSYIDFVKSSNMTFSDASVLKLIRLYYLRFRANKNEFTSNDSEEVLKWCDLITDKHQFLDALTAENIIYGLSLTSKWKEAEKYFAMIEDKKPDKSTYSAFISRAIFEGADKLAWKYLNVMASNEQCPRTFIFTEWFEKNQNDKTKIDQMLEYISINALLIPEIDINDFTEPLSKSYNCSLVNINRKGKCPSCSGQLPGVKLMDSEFKKLAATFLEDIIIKSDIFVKSNPKEIERFKVFVEKTVPYDVVIDGLNVAFSRGKLGTAVYSKILAQVVKHFADQDQKCLVIGRNYMDRWPQKEMRYIKANSKLFLVDDLSNDDLFILYAAFKSGPQTNIFSRDLMRQHSHLLAPRMKNIFRRWQQEHQYTLITTNTRVIVRDPILFEIKAHNINFKWHVPFTNENVQASTQTFELPSQWLCMREKLSSEIKIKNILKE